MPIYEYRCQSCDQQFEVLRYGTKADPDICPACGSDRLTRLFSAFAVSAESTVSTGSQPATGASGCGCGQCSCQG